MDAKKSLVAMSSSLTDTPIAVQSIVVVVVAAFIFSTVSRWSHKVKAPRVGKNPWISGISLARKDFVRNGKQLTKLGYDQHKEKMFWIQTGDMDRLVLSNHYLNELRKFPSAIVDSKQAVVERNLGWYNRVDVILKSSTHVEICRNQLVQNLGMPDLGIIGLVLCSTETITQNAARELEGICRRELSECFIDNRGMRNQKNLYEPTLGLIEFFKISTSTTRLTQYST